MTCSFIKFYMFLFQLSNNRERCLEMLTNESPNYLFGPEVYSNSHTNELQSTLCDLNIGEQRARSDSSGSNMSNASSSSSSSRPQLGMVNRPGYRGPITTFENHPSTAPVVSTDISMFMENLSMVPNASTSEIPRINCDNGSGNVTGVHGYVNRTDNHSCGAPHPSGNLSASMSPGALRPIAVQHIKTHNESRDSPTPSQQSYTYEIKIHPQNPSWMFQPTPQNMISYPSSEEAVAPHNFHPSNQHQQYIPAPATSPYKSPGEEKPSFGAYAQGPFGHQQSSQATIFITNTAAASGSQTYTMPRTLMPTGQAQYNPGSLTDIRLSPNTPVNRSISQNSQQSPQGMTGNVVFEIKPPPRVGGVVQSHIQFFDKMIQSNSGQSGGVGQHPPHYGGHVSPQNENPVPGPTPRHPERPTVINFHGFTSRQDDGFLKFPSVMPNKCDVPEHQHGLVQKSHSVESPSEPVCFRTDRHIPSSQSFVSPASSHSSLSSGSSAQQTNERQRSGSVDDPAYLQGNMEFFLYIQLSSDES